MTNNITAKVLKPHMGPDGIIVQVGDTITVDEHRHRALVKKGYLPRENGVSTSIEERPSRNPGALTNATVEPRRQRITGRAQKGPQPVISSPTKPVPETVPAVEAVPVPDEEANENGHDTSRDDPPPANSSHTEPALETGPTAEKVPVPDEEANETGSETSGDQRDES